MAPAVHHTTTQTSAAASRQEGSRMWSHAVGDDAAPVIKEHEGDLHVHGHPRGYRAPPRRQTDDARGPRAAYGHNGYQKTGHNAMKSDNSNDVIIGSAKACGVKAVAHTPNHGNRTCTGLFVTRIRPGCTTRDLERHVRNTTGYRVKPDAMKGTLAHVAM